MLPLDGYDRYAVYWAPPEGSALARFGASWLGWDPSAGRDVAQPVLSLPRPFAELTRAPRRYGFHATLKAPFRLVAGATPAELDQAIGDLAQRSAPAFGPRLEPSLKLGFLALVPGGPAPGISALADSCLREIDRFRAPPSAEEIARRHSAKLTPRQAANLRDWGYPFVRDDFRFHMTLSGRLAPGEAAPMRTAAARLASPLLEPIFRLDHICLFGDPGPGLGFRLLRRYALLG